MQAPLALQHAPQGVSVHDPPLDHAPAQVACVRLEQPACASQHVPHGCVVHVEPAGPHAPAHEAAWVTVQLPLVQQTPHGDEAHVPPLSQSPAHAAWVVMLHPLPVQQRPVAGAGQGLGEQVALAGRNCWLAPTHAHGEVSVHWPVSGSQQARCVVHETPANVTPPAKAHSAGSVMMQVVPQQHACSRIELEHGGNPETHPCPACHAEPPMAAQIDCVVDTHPTTGVPMQHAPNVLLQGLGEQDVPEPMNTLPPARHAHSERTTHTLLNWQHAPVWAQARPCARTTSSTTTNLKNRGVRTRVLLNMSCSDEYRENPDSRAGEFAPARSA